MLTREEKQLVDSESTLKNIAASTREAVAEGFAVDFEQGLSEKDVSRLRERHGKNQVVATDQVTLFQLLYRQFASSVVVLLLVAAVISLCTGDYLQSVGILIAVFINAIVGFLTEMRAKVSLEALEQIASPTTRALREGKDLTLLASDLVPGDLVKLDAGSRVPADLRIVEDASLVVDESVLTGESISTTKSAHCKLDGLWETNITVKSLCFFDS